MCITPHNASRIFGKVDNLNVSRHAAFWTLMKLLNPVTDIVLHAEYQMLHDEGP